MVEWYRVGATLGDLMDEVQEIVSTVAHTLGTSSPKQWRRTTVREVFREATGLDIAHASAQDISAEDSGWDDAFFRRWVADVEPTLLTPTFVSEWPASQAALSTVRDDGEWPFAERFEVYLNGIELANAFHELIDAKEQRRRCAMANAVRQAEGNAPYPIDTAFVDAVGRMPPTSGIALGFDRLIAALSGWEGIQRGCFPQDRPT